MVAGFQWLPCYHGCWISTVSLLPWLLVFRSYSVAMVAGIPWLLCCHGCDTNRLLSDIETGNNMFTIELSLGLSTVSVFTKVL